MPSSLLSRSKVVTRCYKRDMPPGIPRYRSQTRSNEAITRSRSNSRCNCSEMRLEEKPADGGQSYVDEQSTWD